MSCASKYFFAFQVIGPDPRLRYVPVMITRLLLSLKKANASQEYAWNLGEPTAHAPMKFAERRGVSKRDEIPLNAFASTQEGTQGQT